MKKIIDGHKYDTDTAKLIGEASDYYPGDFKYYCEELYRTKAGFFFLHGEGGPMSRYAEPDVGGGWTGGEKIIPMSEDNAKEWSEDNLDADDYESVFGEVEEDTAQISAVITANVKSKLDDLKKRTGETTAEIITRLIEAE